MSFFSRLTRTAVLTIGPGAINRLDAESSLWFRTPKYLGHDEQSVLGE